MVKNGIEESRFYSGDRAISCEQLCKEDQELFEAIEDCLRKDIDTSRLALQELSKNYYSVVYDTWDNCFIRFKWNGNRYYFCLRMYPDMREDYSEEKAFEIQEKRNRVFWEAEINIPKDIYALKEAIIRSCTDFRKHNPDYYED